MMSPVMLGGQQNRKILGWGHLTMKITMVKNELLDLTHFRVSIWDNEKILELDRRW